MGHTVSDETGRILAIDVAVCDALQRSRQEIVGMSYLDLTHPADRRRNATLVDTLPSEALPIGIRKRYVTPTGTVIEADVTVSRLSTGADGGRLIGTLYRVADADQRFMPDRLWQAAQRLTSLGTLRKDLLGSDLFADHALSLLLQLYIDEAEGRASDLHTLSVTIELGTESTRRWLRALEQKQLIEFATGGIVQLTTRGAQRITRLLSASTG